MSNDMIYTTDFTINLASALSCKCGIRECPMESDSCPFGYDSNDSKLCGRITPSQWVKVLKERVG